MNTDHPVGPHLVGRRIAVLWQGTENGDVWYTGTITGMAGNDHIVLYDDGDEGQYDLTTVQFELMDSTTPARTAAPAPVPAAPAGTGAPDATTLAPVEVAASAVIDSLLQPVAAPMQLQDDDDDEDDHLLLPALVVSPRPPEISPGAVSEGPKSDPKPSLITPGPLTSQLAVGAEPTHLDTSHPPADSRVKTANLAFLDDLLGPAAPSSTTAQPSELAAERRRSLDTKHPDHKLLVSADDEDDHGAASPDSSASPLGGSQVGLPGMLVDDTPASAAPSPREPHTYDSPAKRSPAMLPAGTPGAVGLLDALLGPVPPRAPPTAESVASDPGLPPRTASRRNSAPLGGYESSNAPFRRVSVTTDHSARSSVVSLPPLASRRGSAASLHEQQPQPQHDASFPPQHPASAALDQLLASGSIEYDQSDSTATQVRQLSQAARSRRSSVDGRAQPAPAAPDANMVAALDRLLASQQAVHTESAEPTPRQPAAATSSAAPTETKGAEPVMHAAIVSGSHSQRSSGNLSQDRGHLESKGSDSPSMHSDDMPSPISGQMPVLPLSEDAVEAVRADPDFGDRSTVPGLPKFRQYDQISKLREDIFSTKVPSYEVEFTAAAKIEEIVVGLIPQEELERRERELERSRLLAARQEAEEYRLREQRVLQLQKAAQIDITHHEEESTRRLRRRQILASEQASAREERIRRVFRKAEAQLTMAVQAQEAEVSKRYGTLQPGHAGVRRFRTEWKRLPQPMRIHVDRLRAAKNKLPPGRYVLVATIFDRLGGQPLRWSSKGLSGGFDDERTSATTPQHHRGRFCDIDLVFNQDIYVVAPPEVSLKPSMAIMLELFVLGGTSVYPVDQCVGWAAMPLISHSLGHVSGLFKIPMLRGDLDLNVCKYSQIEHTMANDLDAWLANLRLNITLMPREVLVPEGMKREFDLELSYTSELLRVAQHDALRQQNPFSEDAEGFESDGSESPTAPNRSSRRLQVAVPPAEDAGVSASSFSPTARQTRAKSFLATSDSSPVPKLHATQSFWDRARNGSNSNSNSNSIGASNTAGYEMLQSRDNASDAGVVETKGDTAASFQAPTAPSASASLDMLTTGKQRRLEQLRHAVGTNADGNKRSARNVMAARQAAEPDSAAQSGVLEPSFAVMRQETKGLARNDNTVSTRKLKYLGHAIASELSWSSIATFEFWVQLVLLIIALWSRIYFHYLGQWLFLRALRVPLYDFRATPYSMILRYVSALVALESDIGVLIMGQLSNIIVFAFLILTAWACLRIIGHVPEISSRFVAFFGVATVLDPLLIAIVDFATSNYNCARVPACANAASSDCTCSEGDTLRLYYRFENEEGNGAVGALITLLVFAAITLLACFLLYLFILHIHLDGRLLDVYRRLHAEESEFFVPHDMEVSPAELQWVVAKSRKWKGPKGTIRKVAVCQYLLKDPLDPSFVETTTHLLIYHVDATGQCELYRHFLRQPDGTIMEMFGTMDRQFAEQFGALQELVMSAEDREIDQFFNSVTK